MHVLLDCCHARIWRYLWNEVLISFLLMTRLWFTKFEIAPQCILPEDFFHCINNDLTL